MKSAEFDATALRNAYADVPAVKTALDQAVATGTETLMPTGAKMRYDAARNVFVVTGYSDGGVDVTHLWPGDSG